MKTTLPTLTELHQTFSETYRDLYLTEVVLNAIYFCIVCFSTTACKISLSEQRKEEVSALKRKAASAAARCVFTKKCRNMHHPPKVSGGAVTLDPQ